MYSCSVCGKPVLMINGQAVRVCEHEGKAVVADLKATVYGQSKVNKEVADGLQKPSAGGSGSR